jgi:putative CocE/NonD family hydrolase
LFVIGDNAWRDENEWPLARTQYTPFYLRSGGAANTLTGDGMLSWDKPADERDEPVDTFVYDPRNPVPTRGGGLCCHGSALPPGAWDQRGIEARPDVLVYTSAPLERDVEVTGPLSVRLWAATSAPDTDFTAKLIDVYPPNADYPNGVDLNIGDSIVRARYRNGAGKAAGPLEAGQPAEFTIEMYPTSLVFRKGHRIRLDISSSNFPRFDVNPNTGEPLNEHRRTQTAENRVYHDPARASHILLPIIPAGSATSQR